jgi:hypothetical protein
MLLEHQESQRHLVVVVEDTDGVATVLPRFSLNGPNVAHSKHRHW